MTAALALTTVLPLVTTAPADAAPAVRAGWTSLFVDHAGSADDYSLTRTFISTSATGTSRILYCDGPNSSGGFDLEWARGPRPDGTFHRESVDPADQSITGNASMVVGPMGRSYVSYVTGIFGDQGVLKYATRRSGGWGVDTVDPATSADLTAIALDGNGKPLIAYTKTDGQVWLAQHSPTGWVSSQVTQELRDPTALDIAVDPAGRPRIAYITWDGSAYVLKLATVSGSTWSIQTVGNVATEGIEFDVNLVIDDAGRSRLVFPVLDPVQGLDVARRTASGWHLTSIASGDIWQPTATLDSTGRLHVVFYAATDGALGYAEQTGDGQWAVSTIADSKSPWVRIGRQSSIAMDQHGQAHVSYYVGRATSGTTLRYAVSAGG